MSVGSAERPDGPLLANLAQEQLWSRPINITDYQSLLSVARQQPEPQRLLFVFLRASLPADHQGDEKERFQAGKGGELEPIMTVDKVLDELGSFSDLVAESEQMGQEWQIVLAAGLAGKNGIAPDSAAAEQPLKEMVETVRFGGDLAKYIAFGRDGTLMQFS